MPGSIVGAVQAEVRRTFEQANLPAGSLVLVAASGGADSTCLLHACATVLPVLAGRVAALHVDHGLREQDSTDDANAVRGLAQQLGLPCTVVRLDVAAEAASAHIGIEEAGRLARYRALAAQVARDAGWGAATGHTRDDQAETTLMNLLRGSGPTGLSGIPARQFFTAAGLGTAPAGGWAGAVPVLSVIRPLLSVPRASTVAYCQEVRLPWRTDASNLDPTFLRNRIRHHLLPLLKTYNPSIVENLVGLATLIADDECELDNLTSRAWREVKVGARDVQVSWAVWRDQSASLQRRLLRRAVTELGPRALGRPAIESMRRMLSTNGPGRELSLSGGLRLRTSRQGFQLKCGFEADDHSGPAEEPLDAR